MKKFKKLTSALLSLVTAAAMILPLGANASAAGINYKWTVARSSPNADDGMGRTDGGKANFSVDNDVHTENSRFSIKLENTDYAISYVERTYNVEPNTYYKFSAMVKYSGYQLAPGAEAAESGGCIGKAFSWNNSGYTASNDWRLMEFKFTTEPDQTTINLNLQNGIYNGKCKGTAWFSDVKLEKAELTNKWNILAVIFKNVDATVSINGKTVHHKALTDEDGQNELKQYAFDTLPEFIKRGSENQLSVNSLDCYVVDKTLTEKDLIPCDYQDNAETIPSAYRIDYYNSEVVSSVLDPYLAQKNYNQIVVAAPLTGINGSWAGLGGTKYKNVDFAQINYYKGSFRELGDFGCSVVVHEICHGMERDSKAINPEKTPDLHTGEEYMEKYPELAYIQDNGWFGFFHLYMTSAFPDGRGLDPSVFYRTSGKYTLVDNSMEVGAGIVYDIGSAAPTAPKTLTVKPAEGSTDKVIVSWDAVSGANGYQLTLFHDPDRKEIWTNFDCTIDTTSFSISPITKGKPYYYGLHAKFTQNGKEVYSDWTYLTYTLGDSNVIYGDIDNSGAFDLMDVIAALKIYVNNTDADQRTLNAAGISGRTKLQLGDITALLKAYVNS